MQSFQVSELWSNWSEIIDNSVCRCVVGIERLDPVQPIGDDVPFRHGLITGFLFEHQHSLYWVSAGHVIEGLHRLRGTEREPARFGFADWLGTGTAVPHAPLPVDFYSCPPMWLHDDLIDIGCIMLRHYYWQNMKQAGRQVVASADIDAGGLDYDLFVVTGFPKFSRRSSVRHIQEGGVEVVGSSQAPLVPLELSPTPDGLSDRKLWMRPMANDAQLQDVDGMSGGPVFGVKATGDGIVTRLVGVQCAQSSSGLFGVSPIGDLIAKLAAERVPTLPS